MNLKQKAVQALMRKVMEEHIAFNKLLGLKVESFDAAAPKLRFDMRPELVGNPARQILHGGVISATLDVAGGFAIMLSLAAEMTGIPTSFPNMGTIDLRVDYLRPGRGKYFVATARIVRKHTTPRSSASRPIGICNGIKLIFNFSRN